MDLTTDWNMHLAQLMACRPKGSSLLDSDRGVQVARLMLDFDRETFPWRRSDLDTFWIDVQLMTKYLLTDDEVVAVCKSQPGVENHRKYKEERDAYSMIKRGFYKLREAEKKRNK